MSFLKLDSGADVLHLQLDFKGHFHTRLRTGHAITETYETGARKLQKAHSVTFWFAPFFSKTKHALHDQRNTG